MAEQNSPIDQFLNRELDAPSMRALSDRLASDKAFAQRFVGEVVIDKALRDLFHGESVVDRMDEDAIYELGGDLLPQPEPGRLLLELSAIDRAAGQPAAVDITDQLRGRQLAEKRRRSMLPDRTAGDDGRGALIIVIPRWVLIAAVLAVVAGIGLIVISQSKPASPEGPAVVDRAAPPSPKPAGLPAVSGARLARDESAVWTQSDRPTPTMGRELPAGRYRLESGVAELTYEGGSTVTLLAPAEVDLPRPGGLGVVAGRVSCRVAASGAGFEITAGPGRFNARDADLALSVVDEDVTSYVYAGAAAYEQAGGRIELTQSDQLFVSVNEPARVRRAMPRPNNLPRGFDESRWFALNNAVRSETFDDARVLERFTAGQGYLTGHSTPGRVEVRDGELRLISGLDNTLCCYLQPDGQHLPVGYRWVIDLSSLPTKGQQASHTVFFAISSLAAQPGPASPEHPMRHDASGFRIRWEQSHGGLRIERDGQAPPTNGDFDLEDPGVPTRLAIGRVDEDRFGFWVQWDNQHRWHLIGYREHAGLPLEMPLSVGVEAYSLQSGYEFGFDNLRLEAIPADELEQTEQLDTFSRGVNNPPAIPAGRLTRHGA